MYQPAKRGRERAADLIQRAGYGSVGGMAKGGHADAAEDAAMIKKAIGEHEAHDHPGQKKTRLSFKRGGFAEGGMAGQRLDQKSRGGGGKSKGHTNITVNVAPHPKPGMGMMGTPGAGMALPPHPMPAPGAPPPQPMPAPPRPPMAGGMPPGAMGVPGGMPPGGMPPGGMPPRPMIKRGGKAESMPDNAASNNEDEDRDMLDAQDRDLGRKRGGRAEGGKTTTTNRLADGADMMCEGGRARRKNGGGMRHHGHEGADKEDRKPEMFGGAGSGRGRIDKAERLGLSVSD